MKRLSILAAILLSAFLFERAIAQVNPPGPPVVTYPLNTGTNGTNSTTVTLPAAVGGVTNLALAASQNRRSCFIQNQGSHNMSVSVLANGNNSLTLPPIGGTPPFPGMSCGGQNGIVIGDPLYITGTSGDTVVIWWQ